MPFCAARCGYCDFNTYTAQELPGVSRGSFASTLVAELDIAREELGERSAQTVFVGGGTPTLLDPADLALILASARERFGEPAEATVEANPESVDAGALAALREAGFTRLSLGMQSAAPRVLAALDRRHTPGRAVEAAREARAAGFEHVSVDLIYGAPGETDEDWRLSLETALEGEPDHVSAYALIVEPGTRLAAQVRRGDVPAPDEDAMATRYEMADRLLGDAGFEWYELCNWARTEEARCEHNVGYWRGADWWGAGPGAHSHLRGVRSWNERHPSAWARAVAAGRRPESGREEPTEAQRRTERIMLESRLAEGMELSVLTPAGRAAADALAGEGIVELRDERLFLTLRGRLLADHVTRELDA